MPTVLLLRHAQSVWNAGGRWQGQADPPLSDTGEQQAVSAAARVTGAFDLVITSDLARARRTADVLCTELARRWPGPGPRRVVDPGLREYHVGEWSGLSRPEIDARWPEELSMFDGGALVAPPGGESRSAFDQRIEAASRRIAEVVTSHDARRSLVVTHGGVIRCLMRLGGIPERHIDHLSGYIGSASGGHLSLLHPVDLLEPPAGVSRSAALDGSGPAAGTGDVVAL